MGTGDITEVVDITGLGAVVGTTVPGDAVPIGDLDAGEAADAGEARETEDITGTVDTTEVGDVTTSEDATGGGDVTTVGDVTDTGDLVGDSELAVVIKKLCPNSPAVLLMAGVVFVDSGRDCIFVFLAASIAFAFSGGNFFRISSRSPAEAAGTFDTPVVDDVTGACEDFTVGDVTRGGDVTFGCTPTDDVVAIEAGFTIGTGDFTVVVVVVATGAWPITETFEMVDVVVVVVGSERVCVFCFLASKMACTFSGGNFFNFSSRSLTLVGLAYAVPIGENTLEVLLDFITVALDLLVGDFCGAVCCSALFSSTFL